MRREGAEQQQLLQHLLSDPVKDSLSGLAEFMSVKSKVMDLQRSAGALTEASTETKVVSRQFLTGFHSSTGSSSSSSSEAAGSDSHGPSCRFLAHANAHSERMRAAARHERSDRLR